MQTKERPGDEVANVELVSTDQVTGAASPLQRAFLGVSLGIWVVIVGTVMMRVGGSAAGLMLQFLLDQKFRLDSALVGVIGVAFYISELVGAPYFGTRVDHDGWKPYLVAGPILGILFSILTGATVLLPLFLVVPALFLVRLLGGLGTAVNAPSSLAFLSAASGQDPKVRARAVGYFELAVVGGAALGALVGGFLWDGLAVWGFGILAVLYAATAGLLLLVPKSLPGTERRVGEHPNPWGVLRLPALYRFAPAWIAVNGILGVWLNNFPNQLGKSDSHFPEQMLVGGYSAGTAGYILGAIAGLLGLGIILWSQVLHRFKQSNVMLISLGGALIVCAFMFLLNHQVRGQGLMVLLPLIALVGVGLLIMSGFTPAALSILIEIAERNATDRGTVMGAYSVLLGLGQFLGGALGGIFAQWLGVDGLVILTACFALVAGGSVVYWRQHEAQV